MTESEATRAAQRFLTEVGRPEGVSPEELLGRRFDAGLAWVHFPPGHGGLGLEPRDQIEVDAALAAAGHPAPRDDIAHLMIAPTIAVHGTDEQRTRWLRPLFTGEEIWCQLFSEPGAGSDLATLATRAVRDGSAWIVDGEKVWSTFAHLSRWAMVLLRTDPHVAKHRGLTMFVVDMATSGVNVSPLRQITGQSEFNQVHFDEVQVDDGYRLGGVGEGWGVTLTTLMNERSNVGSGLEVMGGDFAASLQARWATTEQPPRHRDAVVRELVTRESMTLLARRSAAAAEAAVPGPDGSLNKLVLGESNQSASSLLVTLHDAAGTLYPSGYADRGEADIDSFTTGTGSAPAQDRFLRTQANTIEGGTTEVMRNIIGERVLGLPAEPRADKELPWSEIPR